MERRLELPLLVAAVLVIPAIAIEQSDAGDPWDTVAVVLNWTTWTPQSVRQSRDSWTPFPSGP
jgi:hypothetical protein